MKHQSQSIIQNLLTFLNASPTAWHATEVISQKLQDKGFKKLEESQQWEIKPASFYFVTRNGASLCAFVTPNSTPQRTRLIASHTDSPSFKLKPQPEIRKHQAILLGVEIYGAPLISSWLNRDLGLAGRVIYYDQQNQIKEDLVRLDYSPLVIPQLAIHLDREVNEKGLILNKQEHLNVLAALDQNLPSGSYLETLIRQQIDFKALLNFDLFLFPLEEARLLGFKQQLIAAYRIDSLASVHAILQAFLHQTEPDDQDIKMIAFWDHEEIGSHSAHAAGSPFFAQTLERLLLSLGLDREAYLRLLSRSACISVDLAHAIHPNYAEKHDSQHPPFLGKGVVLKSNAQQRYASDARSSAIVQTLASTKQLNLQKFVSRNDIPCGTTIGPIHAGLTGISTVDIGCGQLSMHSCRELMACQDHLDMCSLLQQAFKAKEWPEFC